MKELATGNWEFETGIRSTGGIAAPVPNSQFLAIATEGSL